MSCSIIVSVHCDDLLQVDLHINPAVLLLGLLSLVYVSLYGFLFHIVFLNISRQLYIFAATLSQNFCFENTKVV